MPGSTVDVPLPYRIPRVPVGAEITGASDASAVADPGFDCIASTCRRGSVIDSVPAPPTVESTRYSAFIHCAVGASITDPSTVQTRTPARVPAGPASVMAPTDSIAR